MPERRDFLAVCNDHGVPLSEFQATFCVRCVQPECSRSRSAGLFETRVATWEERLFRNPPRMPKDDPQFVSINAKRFIEVDTGRIPNVRGPSEWVDPRALEEPTPVETPRVSRPVRSRPVDSALTTMEEEPGARPADVPPPKRQAPLNTPFVQGAMLAGAPPPAPKADAWASAPPPSPEALNAPIVKAGARIKFTSG